MSTAIERKAELAVVKIEVPKGCKQKWLRTNTLDSNTREMAAQTRITINGDVLLYRAFKVSNLENGKQVLRLEVLSPCFELVERDEPLPLLTEGL